MFCGKLGKRRINFSHRKGVIYNRDVILEQLNKIELPEKQRKALIEYYGINENSKHMREISAEMGESNSMVDYYIKKSLKTLREHINDFDITYIPRLDEIDNEDRKKIVEALGNYAFCTPNTYNIENLNELVDICKTIEKNSKTSILEEENKKSEIEHSHEILPEKKERLSKESLLEKDIDVLDLSNKAYNTLKRAGVNNLEDLFYKSKYELLKFKGMGKLIFDEIISKLSECGIVFNEDGEFEFENSQEQTELSDDEIKIENMQDEVETIDENTEDISLKEFKESILEKDIDVLDLSNKAYNTLKRAGVNNLEDLFYKSKYELLKFKGMGKLTFDEIISKLSECGIVFNEDGEFEFENSQEQTELSDGEIKIENMQDEVGITDKNTEITEEKEEKTEIELLREKRDKLLEKQRNIQEKLNQAKELSASYDRLNGNIQENENHNLGDE